MYTEIHEWQEFNQKVLYFKLNNAFNLQIDSELNHKISGLYAIYKDDICLYIGQSSNIASRLATHLKGKYNKCTEIFFWNIIDIGFDKFYTKNKDTQSSILNNCEKWLMTKLKPIENINIDMSFKLDAKKTPNICFESCSSFTIIAKEEYLSITDSGSLLIDDIYSAIDYNNAYNNISNDEHNKFGKILISCTSNNFYNKGF